MCIVHSCVRQSDVPALLNLLAPLLRCRLRRERWLHHRRRQLLLPRCSSPATQSSRVLISHNRSSRVSAAWVSPGAAGPAGGDADAPEARWATASQVIQCQEDEHCAPPAAVERGGAGVFTVNHPACHRLRSVAQQQAPPCAFLGGREDEDGEHAAAPRGALCCSTRRQQ